MNADSQCLKNSLQLATQKKLPRRNCLKHFNGRRDISPKCHTSTHILATTRKGGRSVFSDCKEIIAGALCATDPLRAGIMLAHFPKPMSELEHFETVKGPPRSPANSMSLFTMSYNLGLEQHARFGLDYGANQKIADRERLIASKGVMVVIHLFNTAD